MPLVQHTNGGIEQMPDSPLTATEGRQVNATEARIRAPAARNVLSSFAAFVGVFHQQGIGLGFIVMSLPPLLVFLTNKEIA